MKKVIGLCAVILLSSVSVFAQDKQGRHGKERHADSSKRFEKLTEELKLDEKQVAEFQKLNESYRAKMNAERETMKGEREKMNVEREKMRERMMAMKDQRNEDIKKILSDEQYQQYQEKQKAGMQKHKLKMDKEKAKGDKPGNKGKRNGQSRRS